MPVPLRLLIVEDRPADAQLVLHELTQAGFKLSWERVQDELGFLASLASPPDIIVADYYMPQFDAHRALALLQERQLDIPFIIVSGSIGEDLAVAAMRLGASDYLLKDRMARLGTAVAHALEKKQLRDEKRRMEQALKGYLAMLAHELRNPLAPLLLSLVVAREDSTEPAVRRQALDTMARSVRQLAQLVDDLVEATRVSHGAVRLTFGRVDLARLARTAAEDRRRLFQQAGIGLTVDSPETPVWVRGDELRLNQCLHNLLDNAERFTDAGGSVQLAVHHELGQAAVVVRDTGIGMDPGVLTKLFRPFDQADQGLARTRGGLGLGLAVVKALVDSHGGAVEAASDGPGKGTTFTVRIPLESEPAALVDAPAEAAARAAGQKILVIEDNRDAAHSLKLLLELLGYDVAVAYTGPDGVKRALEWLPDLVLSDIGLPGLDGFGVAAALQRHPATSSARLIAVTGYGTEEDRRRAAEVGFESLLTKPVDPSDLERALREKVGGYRSPGATCVGDDV